MLLDDDVVADRQAKSCSLSGGLGGEEGIEHLLLHVRRNASAIVVDRYFDPVTEIFGAGSKNGFVIFPTSFGFALDHRIEAICDQVQKCPRDVLREKVGLAGGRIE